MSEDALEWRKGRVDFAAVPITPNRCWDIIDDTLWWIIKTPILVTILVSHGTTFHTPPRIMQSRDWAVYSCVAGELHPLHPYNPDSAPEDELP